MSVGERPGGFSSSSVHGNARADDDEVLTAERTLAVTSGLNRDAVIEEYRDLFTELVGGLRVGDRNPGAVLFQEKRGGHTRLTEPDHQHAFVFEVHESLVLPRRHRGTEKNGAATSS